MVHIGMPCSSWTRIKDINWAGKRPGCRPLRTDAQPMGIDKHANGDPLTEKEHWKLTDANQLMSFCRGVIKMCIKYTSIANIMQIIKKIGPPISEI